MLLHKKATLLFRRNSRHSKHILPADLWSTSLKERELERVLEFESLPRYCEIVKYRYVGRLLGLKKEDQVAWAQSSRYQNEEYVGLLFYNARKLQEATPTQAKLTLLSPSTGDKILDECVKKIVKRRFSVRLRFVHIGLPILHSTELQRSTRRGKKYAGISTILSFNIKKRANLTRIVQSMRSKVIVVSHPKSQSPYRWCAEHGTSKLDCSILTISELEKTCLSLTSRSASTIITINSLLFILKKCLNHFNLHLFTDHLTTYILFRLRQMSVDHFIRHSAPRGIVFSPMQLLLRDFFMRHLRIQA